MRCKVSNLSKFFKKSPALNDVSATFEEGRITVILGPSGSGKTTLLRCIAGLETATSGDIELGDRTIFSSGREINVPPHRRDLGMMFQSYGLWPHMSVQKNIEFPLQIKNLSAGETRKKSQWALEMVGLVGMMIACLEN